MPSESHDEEEMSDDDEPPQRSRPPKRSGPLVPTTKDINNPPTIGPSITTQVSSDECPNPTHAQDLSSQQPFSTQARFFNQLLFLDMLLLFQDMIIFFTVCVRCNMYGTDH